ncbi:4Fe-4S dicluster domain-containing protein [Candidatus Pyrohabitans sp.]
MVDISIDLDACVGCGTCVDTCPSAVYEMNDEGKSTVVNADDCVECCACVEACPEGAITHSSC